MKIFTNRAYKCQRENENIFFLSDEIYPTITDDERAECDKITVAELTHAFSILNKDSAPGSDRTPSSFYTHFWEKLQVPPPPLSLFFLFFSQCISQTIEKGDLPFTLNNGMITLIHKGNNLDRNDLSNYSPVILTKTDYKIFTKALALRLQKVIKTTINEDQIGFVKGRNIVSHLRLFDGLAKYHNNNNSSSNTPPPPKKKKKKKQREKERRKKEENLGH